MADVSTTPSVVIIGDLVAQGLLQKLPESESIINTTCTTDTIDRVLVADAAVWPSLENNPWFIVCVGTLDRRTDFYRLLNFRARLNRIPNTTGENRHVLWVLPMNNGAAANAVRLVAKKYGDVVIDVPRAITTTTSVPYVVPIYAQQWVPPVYGWIPRYPYYPWLGSYWGAIASGYYRTVQVGAQTRYKVVTNQSWLSNDGRTPNDAGYTYIRDKLRKMTDNWGIKYDEDLTP
jgi:hypothetical protein